jgi:hypothetical protein
MILIRMTKESLISALILLFLLSIGIAVWLEQFSYDERLFHPQVVQPGVLAEKSGTLDLVETGPGMFAPMSDPETFDSGSLSDKIDGKADIYLESGFVRLSTGRFVHKSDPRTWFECFVYDMQSPRNAFSVYSVQKREDATPGDFADLAYLTENAVFFVCGPYYIEIIGAKPSQMLLGAMTEMAENVVQKYPGQAVDLPERNLLPAENLDVHSLRLILKNAFGYEKFDTVFTGTYWVDGQRVTVFLSIRKTAPEAQSLAAGYAHFLAEIADGESVQGKTPVIPGLQIVDVLGEYELIFSKGNILAGIHGAVDKEAALQVADAVYRRLDNITDNIKFIKTLPAH